MTYLDSMIYNVMDVTNGSIYQDPATPSFDPAVQIPTSDSSILVTLSSEFSVMGDLTRVETGTWYPIYSNVGNSQVAPMPHPEYSPTIVGDGTIFKMQTKFLGNDLKFRRLPIDFFPPPYPTECPPLPSNAFICIDGILVALGSIDETSIQLPPGTVIIFGNLTTSSPITFSGTSTNINVTGCIVTPGIEISLEGQKDPSVGLPSGSVLLASQGIQCTQSIDVIPLTIKQSSKSCKKVKVKKDENLSTSTSLSVIFEIDNSDCNLKWIILGSVLGGVLLITIILVLIFSFSKSARECARPFSARAKP